MKRNKKWKRVGAEKDDKKENEIVRIFKEVKE